MVPPSLDLLLTWTVQVSAVVAPLLNDSPSRCGRRDLPRFQNTFRTLGIDSVSITPFETEHELVVASILDVDNFHRRT